MKTCENCSWIKYKYNNHKENPNYCLNPRNDSFGGIPTTRWPRFIPNPETETCQFHERKEHESADEKDQD